jgi:hypothetical protein
MLAEGLGYVDTGARELAGDCHLKRATPLDSDGNG